MGRLSAMEGFGRDRYSSGQRSPSFSVNSEAGNLVSEEIEGRVPFISNLHEFVNHLIGGLRSGMGYASASSLDNLRMKTGLMRITNVKLVESHPHNIIITKEAPNYQLTQD
jgi:IMP dehydrogenase